MWGLRLVDSTQSPSIVHLQALNFVVPARIPGFKCLRLANDLVAQGLRDASDYYFLKNLLLHPQMEKPLAIIKHLIGTPINDTIFAKIAAHTLRNPLVRFSDVQAIMTWGTSFVRRAFHFIGLSTARRRYWGKQNRVLSLFDGLMDLRVEWLNRVVLRYYGSLVNTNRISHTVPGFAVEKIADYQFLSELDQMQRQQIALKTFLGTGCVEVDLPPVAPRAATSKKKPGDIKPNAAKMIARNTKTPRLKKPVPARARVNRSQSSGSAPVVKS
jgi:hypothetical protein